MEPIDKGTTSVWEEEATEEATNGEATKKATDEEESTEEETDEEQTDELLCVFTLNCTGLKKIETSLLSFMDEV